MQTVWHNLSLTLFLVFFLPLLACSQTKVSKINFSGNSYLRDDQLNDMIASKPGSIFLKEQLDLDLKNIIKNYQKGGYLNCRISKIEEDFNFDSSAINLNVSLEEGTQVLIGEIIFQGNKTLTSAELRRTMFTRPGAVLNISALTQDIDQILNKYEQRGFAFAQVGIKEISGYVQGGIEKLRIILKIDENEKIKVNNVSIEGNTTTKDYVISREVRLGKNNIMTRGTILEIRQRLENLGYFESVEQPKLYKYNDRIVLKIKVKEGNTNTFDGIVGYAPPSAGEDKGYFTGLINLSLRNLFGTGRRIDARWEKEVKATQELELKYTEPWFLGYPVNIAGEFLQRIQDSTYVRRNAVLKTEALISKSFSASVLGNFERVIPTLGDGEPVSGGNIYTVFDSRMLSAGTEIKFDSRDYVYNPSSGILYRTGYTVGQKRIYNAASFIGFDLPDVFTVQRLMVDIDLYHSFFRRQSSLVGLHGGEVRSPKLVDADYFRFGGIHSVRGYRDGQFLASRLGWANLEMRYSLARKSFASLFYDFGYYRRPVDEITKTPEQKGFVFGYGLGIRVETKLGIFGVSYALGKGDSILEGKVHFGLINDF